MLERARRVMERLGTLGTTVVALGIWEIGARVGIPGLDAKVLDAFIKSGAGNWMTRLYDTIAGGALSRGAVLGLGILPYLSARIWMRLARFVSPTLQRMSANAEGRERIKNWTRVFTVILAALQSIGFAIRAQSIGAAPSGAAFVIQTLVLMTTGATFAMLASESLTGRLAVEKEDADSGAQHDRESAQSSARELTPGAAAPVATHTDADLVRQRADQAKV